ncbi:peptidase [Rouxiella sp. S1S-2]|nr:peptidase [Rouxiella sp. S1S-2]
MTNRLTKPQVRRDKLSLNEFFKRHRAIWCLLLLPLMSACSTTTTQYVNVPVTPIPASLLAQCQPSPPPSDPLTYGASVLWNELLLTDLENCNTQLHGIRQIEVARQQ